MASKAEKLYYAFAQEVSPQGFIGWGSLPMIARNGWERVYELAVALYVGTDTTVPGATAGCKPPDSSG
jgi:hypothetical protein